MSGHEPSRDNPPPLFDELLGEHVMLRPWRPEDEAGLWEAVDSSREHLGFWMPWVAEYHGPEAAAAFIAQAIDAWERRTNLWVAIIERESGRLLGGTGYNTPDWSLPGVQVGYWIRADAEGQGFVSEATRLLVDHAFDAWSAVRIELLCDPRNIRSRAVAERTGFVLEGRLRHHVRDSACEPRDALVFSIVRSDRDNVAASRVGRE